MNESCSARTVVQQFIDRFKNDHDHAALDDLLAPTFVHHFDLPGIASDGVGFRLLAAAILAAFPDVRVTVDLLLADGDRVVERASVRATHTGPFQNFRPTGHPVAWTETHVYRVQDGRIAELWPELRFEALLAQLRRPDPTAVLSGEHL